MKRIFPKESIQNSEFAYQTFKKKGYRVLPNLTVKMMGCFGFREDGIGNKLLRIFKKTKFVISLDLNESSFWRWDFSKILFLIKKLSKILKLSVQDVRNCSDYYKGFEKLWPRHMKNLISLSYKPVIEQPNIFTEMLNLGEMPKKIELMTDFFHYFKGLENLEIDGSSGFSDYLNQLWKFENYPTSIKKLSFTQIKYKDGTPNISLAHLKQLKDLKFNLSWSYTTELTNSVVHLLSQTSQLEALILSFERGFKIDSSVCKIIKSLTKLKKVEFELYMDKEKQNLRILDSLVECPLESLNLKVYLLSCEEVSLISDFLEQKKDLRSLKLHLDFDDVNDNDSNIRKLVQVIDSLNLLTNLRFSTVFDHGMREFNESFSCLPWDQPKPRKEIESAYQFPQLLSKIVLLRKFRIAINQPDITKDYFFGLLDLLNRTSSTLEKLEINFEGYKPQDEIDAERIMSFIRNLKNIRSLKLKNFNIHFTKVFSDLLETVSELKFLKTLHIGDISGEVSKQMFLDGVGKILLKYGIRKFACESTLDFGRDNSNPQGLRLIKLNEVFKKNPFLLKYPAMFIYQSLWE